MAMSNKANYPRFYNGWRIMRKRNPKREFKFSAYNYTSDKFINPIFDTFLDLKEKIDSWK